MARKLSTRAALAAASALLLLLYVTSINSNTRALLSSGHDDNSPVFPSHLQDGQPSRTTAGGGVRFKPGVRLPNEGRTEGEWGLPSEMVPRESSELARAGVSLSRLLVHGLASLP